jgi:2TM domain
MPMNSDNQEADVPQDGTGAEPPGNGRKDADEVARQEAIAQIKRRRRFHIELVVSGIGMALLVLIWATTEYHNAGGWPTQGFSQSSGIHDVWNYWIIYPVGAWILIMAGRAWSVYRHRGISESDIKREIDRRARRG